MKIAGGAVAAGPRTPPAPRAAAAHATSPTLAKALFALWGNDTAVVIDSPPGAGKTYTITNLAHQLATRAGMLVSIAAQTRAQAVDVANRTAALGVEVAFLDGAGEARPADLAGAVTKIHARTLRPSLPVVVATSARWQWTEPKRRTADVLLVDEAYQLTFADLGALTTLAPQIALVGDPGQIAPVVTASTRRWDHIAAGPHTPAPAALVAAHPDAVTRLRLPNTWRLGPATTDLIRPLYSIEFGSARPPRHLTRGGVDLPEFTAHPVTVTGGPSDSALILTAARTARDLIATASVHADGTTRALKETDVAVIAPHVEQATLLAAALADLPGVYVGTTNQAQGLEREAVVAVHPLAGYASAPSFATDLGRTCVSLSRHRSHLTMVTDAATPSVLARALRDDPTAHATAMQSHLLDRLTA